MVCFSLHLLRSLSSVLLRTIRRSVRCLRRANGLRLLRIDYGAPRNRFFPRTPLGRSLLGVTAHVLSAAHFFTNDAMKSRRNLLRFNPDSLTALSSTSFSCLEIAIETYTVFLDLGISETYQS
jgi:hypothetical protein